MKYKKIILTIYIIIAILIAVVIITFILEAIRGKQSKQKINVLSKIGIRNYIFQEYDFPNNPFTGEEIRNLFDLVTLNNIENSELENKQISMILDGKDIAIYLELGENFSESDCKALIKNTKEKIDVNKNYEIVRVEYNEQTGYLWRIIINEK